MCPKKYYEYYIALLGSHNTILALHKVPNNSQKIWKISSSSSSWTSYTLKRGKSFFKPFLVPIFSQKTSVQLQNPWICSNHSTLAWHQKSWHQHRTGLFFPSFYRSQRCLGLHAGLKRPTQWDWYYRNIFSRSLEPARKKPMMTELE